MAWNSRSTDGLRLQPPEQSKTRAVPADKRIWSYDRQRPLPRKESAQNNQSEFGRRDGPATSSLPFLVEGELSPKEQVLRDELKVRPKPDTHKIPKNGQYKHDKGAQ
jgi:hypothetical protein